MKYSKPEITLLKAAAAAIQGSGKTGLAYDNPIMKTHVTVPAYEADEWHVWREHIELTCSRVFWYSPAVIGTVFPSNHGARASGHIVQLWWDYDLLPL